MINILFDAVCVNEDDRCWWNQIRILYRNPDEIFLKFFWKGHYFLRVTYSTLKQSRKYPWIPCNQTILWYSGIGPTAVRFWYIVSVVSPQDLCPVVYGMCLCRSSATKIVTPMRNCWDGSLMAWCVRESCIMTSMMPARWELTDNNNGDDDNNNNNNRHVFALHSSK